MTEVLGAAPTMLRLREALLSGPGSLYGIIDLAREPHLYETVRQLGQDVTACLFGGPLHPDLVRVSPHLVRLNPSSPLLNQWIETGWRRSWGIFCRSEIDFLGLRRHFKRFLQIKLPDDRSVLFRYYDPRVWRTYITTCDTDELTKWFVDIDEYLVETEEGVSFYRYRFHNRKLLVSTGISGGAE